MRTGALPGQPTTPTAMMPGQIPDPSVTAGSLPGLGPLTGLPSSALTTEELKYADIRNIGAMIAPLHFLEVKLGKRPQPVKSEVQGLGLTFHFTSVRSGSSSCGWCLPHRLIGLLITDCVSSARSLLLADLIVVTSCLLQAPVEHFKAFTHWIKLDEEEERRKRRREKNKVAAARCRNKKKERTEFLQRESERLELMNAELKTQIEELKLERQQLILMLNRHRPTCIVRTDSVRTPESEGNPLLEQLDKK
ncbi:hypothetical protein STEG23_014905 [Scotinomys teguina]